MDKLKGGVMNVNINSNSTHHHHVMNMRLHTNVVRLNRVSLHLIRVGLKGNGGSILPKVRAKGM